MSRFAKLLAVLAFTGGTLSTANTPRYFKEDGGVEATYIKLLPDGSYSVTDREHTFLREEESGRWSKTGSRIAFTPQKPDASPYKAEEVSYGGTTFLGLLDDGGPSIKISVSEIKKELDQYPKARPPYVFFEVSSSIYDQETKQTYPFHSHLH